MSSGSNIPISISDAESKSIPLSGMLGGTNFVFGSSGLSFGGQELTPTSTATATAKSSAANGPADSGGGYYPSDESQYTGSDLPGWVLPASIVAAAVVVGIAIAAFSH